MAAVTFEEVKLDDNLNQVNAQQSDQNPSLKRLLKTLVLGDNRELKTALSTFDTKIREEKLNKKKLEDIILNIIKAEKEALVTVGTSSIVFLVEKFFTIYEESRKEKLIGAIPDLFLSMSAHLKTLFPEHFNGEVENLALSFWTKVSHLGMGLFLDTFNIREKINREDILPIVHEFVDQDRLKEAAGYISVLNLHVYFDMDDLIYRLGEEKDVLSIKYLVKGDPELQKKAIGFLMEQRNASQAADIVKDLKLNHKQFPGLLEILQKNCLRFFAREYDWMSLEDKVRNSKALLSFIVEDFVKHGKMDIACSIIRRHGLIESRSITNGDTYKKVAPYFKNPGKQFTYLENKLFANDAFAPAEELIGEAPPGTYIHFKDFGIDSAKDLLFIDKDDTDEFDGAAAELLTSQEVGLDSEFKFNMTKLDVPTGTDLLQLATHKKVYLFDSLELATSTKYHNLVKELLSNPSIQIVGHTLSADIHKLKHDQNDSEPLVIKNEIDVAKIYKKLFPTASKYSLAAIVQDLLKKPMSKYDQVSNWIFRPLRKAQMHYAGMDAFIVLKVFEKLKEEILLRVIISLNSENEFLNSIKTQPKNNKRAKRVTKDSESENEEELKIEGEADLDGNETQKKTNPIEKKEQSNSSNKESLDNDEFPSLARDFTGKGKGEWVPKNNYRYKGGQSKNQSHSYQAKKERDDGYHKKSYGRFEEKFFVKTEYEPKKKE